MSLSSEGSCKTNVPEGSTILTSNIASGEIEFRNVWFKYPNTSTWILRKFNLVIKPGVSVGIVGEPGSGKSTIMKLLYRFYEPQEGYI